MNFSGSRLSDPRFQTNVSENLETILRVKKCVKFIDTEKVPYGPKKIFSLLLRGASKIKLKKVNKKRTVTVRRVIIFLNICLQCCLHQYKTLKAVAAATVAIVLLTPAKNLKKVFWGFLVVSPLFNHFLG